MLALAFYIADSKSAQGNGHLMDKAIAWWTRPNLWNPFKSGRFSHVELAFGAPDENGLTECFSSSPRDGGTRWKRIDLGDGKWEVVPQPYITAAAEEIVRQWCNDHLNRKYDWAGVFGFVFSLTVKEDPDKLFCSETSIAAEQPIRLWLDVLACKISPNRCHRMASEMLSQFANSK